MKKIDIVHAGGKILILKNGKVIKEVTPKPGDIDALLKLVKDLQKPAPAQ
jgi:hypothetical protein